VSSHSREKHLLALDIPHVSEQLPLDRFHEIWH